METQSQSTTEQSNSHLIQLTAELVHGEVKIGSDLKGTIRLQPGSRQHRFTFTLQDKTFPSMGVRFCTVEEGLLDIDESTDCPPKRSGINTDQVDPRTVTLNGKTAAFTDKNSGDERTLSYALHFKCDDPAQKAIFDPEIRNGGDGRRGAESGWNTGTVAAAVAGLAAIAVAFLWFT